MTQPAPPPLDPGNQLLGETPAQLSTALLETPAGQRMALTIRTPSTTLTVLLGHADAKAWSGQLAGFVSQMSSSGLIVANGHAPVVPKGQG